MKLASGEDGGLTKKQRGLQPHDIDAYWLQRKLSKFQNDPMVAQKTAGDILDILMQAKSDSETETKLVLLLGCEQFELIKVLREHRQMSLFFSVTFI